MLFPQEMFMSCCLFFSSSRCQVYKHKSSLLLHPTDSATNATTSTQQPWYVGEDTVQHDACCTFASGWVRNVMSTMYSKRLQSGDSYIIREMGCVGSLVEVSAQGTSLHSVKYINWRWSSGVRVETIQIESTPRERKKERAEFPSVS